MKMDTTNFYIAIAYVGQEKWALLLNFKLIEHLQLQRIFFHMSVYLCPVDKQHLLYFICIRLLVLQFLMLHTVLFTQYTDL